MPAEEIDSISLGLRGDASSLLTALTRGANAVIKFTKTVTGEAEKATSTLDKMFTGSARAVGLLQTPLAELSPELATLSNVVTRLAETFRKADTEIGNAGKTTKKTTEEIQNSASAVNRLSREYRAGALSVEEYTARLRTMAETAAAGSEAQLAAMARLRQVRDKADQEAERAANRRAAKAVKDIADAAKDEKKATNERIADLKRIEAAQAKADREHAQATRKQNRGEATIAHGLGSAGDALTLGVTAPALFAGWDAVKASSSLNESQNKVKVIFKESAGEIAAWAKTTDEAFAMSERATLDQVASVGNMLIEQGKEPAVAAAMSKSLVTLAGDYASMRDVQPEVAMTKFRAAMAGVSRPLREWGIDVSVAALKAEAYASGIAKPTVNLAKLESAQFRVGEAQMKLSVATEKYGKGSYEAAKAQDALNRAEENLRKTQAGSVGQLTAAQKTQAAYNLILKHSSAAQGDFARTAQEEANSRRRLQAEIENLAAAYGKLLIPALVRAEHALEGVVKWFKSLSPEQKQNVVHLLEFAAALGPTIKLLGLLVQGFIFWQKASLFLKDLPNLLTGIAAKMAAVETAEAGAAAEMTVLSGATAIAETALTSMGIAGVTGITAITVAVGLLAVALAGIAADIWLIKRDWDAVAETIERNNQSAADDHNTDYVDKTGINNRLKRESAVAKRYGDFLKGRKGSRADFTGEMDENELKEFNEAFPVPTGDAGVRLHAAVDPVAAEQAMVAKRVAQLDTQIFTNQQAADKERTKKTVAGVGNGVSGGAAAGAVKPPPAPHIPRVPVPHSRGGAGGASFRPDVDAPHLDDLEAMEELLSSSNVMTLPTSAKTYGPQKQELEDRASKQDADTLKSGKPPTEFANYQQEQQRLGYARNLAEAAEGNTQAAIASLLEKEKRDAEALLAAHAAVNAEIHRQNGLKAAGQKLTQADAKRYADLSAAYRAANGVVKADNQAIEENKRVHREAVNDKIHAQKSLNELVANWNTKTNTEAVKGLKDKLAAGTMSRDAFDQQLKDAITKAGAGTEGAKPFENALEESVVAKANAVRDLHLKALQLDGKDFQSRREAVTEEADNFRKNGASDADVTAFVDKSNKKIGQDEWEQTFRENQTEFQEDLEDGTTSLDEYKAFLTQSMKEAGEQFTQGSSKVRELRREIERLTFQQVDEQAEGFRRSLDEGDISIEGYVARLRELQSTVPAVSSEYRKLQAQIDQTNRKMRSDAHASADRIGSEYGGMFVKLLRRTATFGQMLRETLNKAVDDAIAGMIKRWLSSQIFKIIMKGNEQKQAAEDKQAQAAGVQIGAANHQITAAGLQNDAADKQLKAAQINQATQQAAAGAAGAAGGGVGTAGTSLPGANGTSSQLAGVGMNLAGAGAFGSAAASAMPWVAGALAVSSLVMGFLNKPQKPDYTTHMGSGRFASIGQGDHTGLIDSGYSGVEGMRQLASARAARQNTANGSGKTIKNMTHIAKGAIVIQSQPHHDEEYLANLVVQKITDRAAFENSLTGNS